MIAYLIAYVSAAVVFLGVDAVYLRFIGGPMYRAALGDQLLEQFRPAPAVIFYLAYVAGLLYFAISPALDSGRWTTAFGRGAALGFLAYGTYDLTNYATLVRWQARIAVADIVWGTLLSGVAAAIAMVIASRWTR